MVCPKPSVFLIDPVSRVIEKKQYIHCDYQGPGFSDKGSILAIKDRVFFACHGTAGTQVTVVAGSGPDQVIRRFHLTHLPV